MSRSGRENLNFIAQLPSWSPDRSENHNALLHRAATLLFFCAARWTGRCWTAPAATGCDPHERTGLAFLQATSSCFLRRQTYSKEIRGQVTTSKAKPFLMSDVKTLPRESFSFFKTSNKSSAAVAILQRATEAPETLLISQTPKDGSGTAVCRYD